MDNIVVSNASVAFEGWESPDIQPRTTLHDLNNSLSLIFLATSGIILSFLLYHGVTSSTLVLVVLITYLALSALYVPLIVISSILMGGLLVYMVLLSVLIMVFTFTTNTITIRTVHGLQRIRSKGRLLGMVARDTLEDIHIPYSFTLAGSENRFMISLGLVMPPPKRNNTRLCWKCECGQRFCSETSEWQDDVSSLHSMIQKILHEIYSAASIEAITLIKKSTVHDEDLPNDGETTSNELTISSGNNESQDSSSRITELEESYSNPQFLSRNEIGSNENDLNLNIARQRRKQKLKAKEDPYPRWIIIGLPCKEYKVPEHVEIEESWGDLQLFREMRAQYKKHRGSWHRLLKMRDVNNVKLVQFHLRQFDQIVGKTFRRHAILSKTDKYEPPIECEDDWEYEKDSPGADSLSGFLTYMWHISDEGHKIIDTAHHSRNQDPILPTHESQTDGTPPVKDWMSKIKEVRIYVYDKDFLSFTFPDFLRKTGVEIEVDSHALHALHEIPKKIRTRLSVDPNARKPVTGWGLWIEEDFIIPWVVLVIINLIPFSTLIVGLVETSKHGPTWIALSAYGVTLSTFLFSQWVVMMKDSKR